MINLGAWFFLLEQPPAHIYSELLFQIFLLSLLHSFPEPWFSVFPLCTESRVNSVSLGGAPSWAGSQLEESERAGKAPGLRARHWLTSPPESGSHCPSRDIDANYTAPHSASPSTQKSIFLDRRSSWS